MKKTLTYTIQIRLPDGKLHKLNDFTPEERREIGVKLNCQAMEALGYHLSEKQKDENG